MLVLAMVVIACGGAHAKSHVASGDKGTADPKPSLSLESRVKLDLSKHAVSPGGSLKTRIDNGSTTDLEYGRAQGLQRYEHGRWVKLPEKPVLQPLYVVRAGEVGRWQSLHIPNKAEPGRYRVRRMVTPISSKQSKQHALFGYFNVCKKCMVGVLVASENEE